MTDQTDKFLGFISYPTQPTIRKLAKSPLFLWRVGLGPVLGGLFMIITTTGRKSGLPRRTPVEYHKLNGRKYIFAGWPNSDWYKNIQADPHVTIQTSDGIEAMTAHRLTGDQELSEAYDMFEQTAFMQAMERVFGVEIDKASFLKDKDQYHILTFEPTNEETPPPQPVDLPWLLPAMLAVYTLGWLAGRRRQ